MAKILILNQKKEQDGTVRYEVVDAINFSRDEFKSNIDQAEYELLKSQGVNITVRKPNFISA